MITQYNIYGFGAKVNSSPYKQNKLLRKRSTQLKKQQRQETRSNSQRQKLIVNLSVKVPLMTINRPSKEESALISKLMQRPNEWIEQQNFSTMVDQLPKQQSSPVQQRKTYKQHDFSYKNTIQNMSNNQNRKYRYATVNNSQVVENKN